MANINRNGNFQILDRTQSLKIMFLPPIAIDWFAPQVLAALIGAILGGLVASFLKEVFGDYYHKQRRLREIRTEIIKAIGQYHGFFQRWTRNSNEIRFGRFVSDAVRNSTLDQETKDKQIDHITRLGDGYREESREFSMQANELEATIVALSYECKHYLSRKSYNKLREIVDTFFSKIQFDTVVTEYEKMEFSDLSKLEEYSNTTYITTTGLMYQSYRNRFKTFISLTNDLI